MDAYEDSSWEGTWLRDNCQWKFKVDRDKLRTVVVLALIVSKSETLLVEKDIGLKFRQSRVDCKKE